MVSFQEIKACERNVHFNDLYENYQLNKISILSLAKHSATTVGAYPSISYCLIKICKVNKVDQRFKMKLCLWYTVNFRTVEICTYIETSVFFTK